MAIGKQSEGPASLICPAQEAILVKAQILVVRVYQWRRNGKIMGLLEAAESGEQRPFRSFRELRQLMMRCLAKIPR